MHAKPERQRGVALIIAMMLLFLAVLVGAEVMDRLERDRTRTQNVLLQEQAWAYLLGAEALAVRALAADQEEDQREGEQLDACSEASWAAVFGPLPYDNGIFVVSIQDLQGRLNINNLLQAKGGERVLSRPGVERLKRLLRETLPDDSQAGPLAEEAADWLDSNSLVDGLGGAEDTEYEAWRTGNQPAAHVSELRALRSAVPATWQAVADGKVPFTRYITALPLGTRVNVNTAPAAVLAALVPGMDASAAAAIKGVREKTPFTSVDEVLALPELAGLSEADRKELKGLLVTGSEYFQIVSQVTVGERTARLVSQVYRPAGGGTARVIQRDAGAVFAAPEEACNPP